MRTAYLHVGLKAALNQSPAHPRFTCAYGYSCIHRNGFYRTEIWGRCPMSERRKHFAVNQLSSITFVQRLSWLAQEVYRSRHVVLSIPIPDYRDFKSDSSG